MSADNDPIKNICSNIVISHLEFTANIQDLKNFTGTLEELKDLYSRGTEILFHSRKLINEIRTLTYPQPSLQKRLELTAIADQYASQFETAMTEFRSAALAKFNILNEGNRESLFSTTGETQHSFRNRKNKQYLSEQSCQITERLLSISKNLSETLDQSSYTLGTLVTSSDKVTDAKKELENQQHVIFQSGKLLGKYGRREMTDKALLALAFLFFLACVFYILQRRLF